MYRIKWAILFWTTNKIAVSSLANINEKQSFTVQLHFFFLFLERGVCVPPRTDDDFLIRFLRARFFKIETAYGLVCSIELIRFNCIGLFRPFNLNSWKFVYFVLAMPLLWFPWIKSRLTYRCASIFIGKVWWRRYCFGNTISRSTWASYHDL